jgi:hypothetical protein
MKVRGHTHPISVSTFKELSWTGKSGDYASLSTGISSTTASLNPRKKLGKYEYTSQGLEPGGLIPS